MDTRESNPPTGERQRDHDARHSTEQREGRGGEPLPEYLDLTQAAQSTPGRPSTNCVWRWCRRGVLARNGQRIRLRHVRLGGRLYTRRSWLDEFGQALADADASYFGPSDTNTADATSLVGETTLVQRRRREIEDAERELDEAGL